MDIVRPDAAAAATKPAAAGTEEAAKGFEKVLSEVDLSQARLHPTEAVVPGLAEGPAKAEALRQDKLKIAREPGGIERLGLEMERGTVRLQEIMDELQSGRTFSPQELLAVQAEMHEITLSIEVTTKVVAETVSGVKHLMQQQG
jgi:hypothetical protein